MPQTIVNIMVNGERREIPSEQSVASLLEWLKIAPDHVAVELNKSIVRRRDWNETIVPGGSHIEIVEFVGGG